MYKAYAIKIELLLRDINPQRKIGCEDVEFCPYEAIFNTLNGRSEKLLQHFTSYYNGIEKQSLLDLIHSSYNMEKLIGDLENIKNEYLKEIN